MIRLVRRGDDTVRFPKPTGMSDPLFRLLSARGISSVEEASEFLSPSIDQLHDPMLLSAMQDAVSMIEEARRENLTVCVYGDYDVDGVCATAILSAVLAKQGIRARSYIPSRHGEGYGLNERAIREIAQWAGLLITVDCGVTATEQVALCAELGLPVIVTDHHQIGAVMPDCPVVNPLLGGYPFPSLCGAGVALKLAMALDRDAALEMLDLAALATVADVVPLRGENRVIVALGLQMLRNRPRPGLAALALMAGIKTESLSAGGIAFGLAPRLNAGGRLGDADRSLQLLMADTVQGAEALARELEEENRTRRDVEQAILGAARGQMMGFDFVGRRAIVLHGLDWNAGVIGLAASRLVEQYHMPTVLLTGDGAELSGSCRSIPGVDIHGALSACAHLLIRFGGHKQAAGLTISADRVSEFADALNAHLLECADPEAYVPSAEYDLEMDTSELTEELVWALSKMEPFGFGNPAPVMLTEARVVTARAVGVEGAHLSMRLQDEGRAMSAIGFRMGGRACEMDGWVRVLHQPKINEYQGNTSVQMELKAVLPPAPMAQIRDAKPKWPGMLRVFLTEKVYNWAWPKNEATDAGAAAKPRQYSGMSGVAELLSAAPYGTLVVATCLDRLTELIELCQERGLTDRFDLLMGRWPGGEQPTNAICALPRGEMPKGYRRVVMLDAPGALLGSVEDVIWLEPEAFGAKWLDDVPDVDGLRALYMIVRDFAKRPVADQSLEALLSSLAGDGRDQGASVALGLPVLRDMGLIELSLDPARIGMRPVVKTDPEQNRIYQWLRGLKTREGGGDIHERCD